MATDYFLTIGGGYKPAANQASLEANVLFFQRILSASHRGSRVHDVFFADGSDPGDDLQVLGSTAPAKAPAAALIATLHRQNGPPIEYRNHEIPQVTGANDPELIRAALSKIAHNASEGDRLILYVTAHGGAAQREEQYNTTISCWDGKSISVRDLATWLDEFPVQVPVLMVMAQCYCGGFAHTIFADADEMHGLAKPVRAGFFAQQHNLAAAGCRPDVENDEEFSSYFWGALIGSSRTGEPMPGCDANGDGTISFDEAYANAMVIGETIDIPLKTSDVLLRKYSRIPDYELLKRQTGRRGRRNPSESSNDEGASSDEGQTTSTEAKLETPSTELQGMCGSLESVVADEQAATQRIVREISRQLGILPHDDVSKMIAAFRDEARQSRSAGRRSRRRGGSGRRRLWAEVAEKWPELADAETWETSPLLRDENQERLWMEIKQLPSYEAYAQRRDERERLERQSQQAELRDVKYHRLINTLESVVLAKNLPRVAPPEVVEHYEKVVRLEGSSLSPSP